MNYKALDEYVKDFRSPTAASLELGVTAKTVIKNIGESGTSVVILGDEIDALLTQLNRFDRVSGEILSICDFKDGLKMMGGNKTLLSKKSECSRDTIARLLGDSRKAVIARFKNGEIRIMREVGC